MSEQEKREAEGTGYIYFILRLQSPNMMDFSFCIVLVLQTGSNKRKLSK